MNKLVLSTLLLAGFVGAPAWSATCVIQAGVALVNSSGEIQEENTWKHYNDRGPLGGKLSDIYASRPGIGTITTMTGKTDTTTELSCFSSAMWQAGQLPFLTELSFADLAKELILTFPKGARALAFVYWKYAEDDKNFSSKGMVSRYTRRVLEAEMGVGFVAVGDARFVYVKSANNQDPLRYFTGLKPGDDIDVSQKF